MSGSKRSRPKTESYSGFNEHDHDMLYTHLIEDAREHARRLCGLLPYSHAQVVPIESARIIWRLIALAVELMESRGVRARRELERDLAGMRRENVRLWQIEARYKAMCEGRQQELPFPRAGA